VGYHQLVWEMNPPFNVKSRGPSSRDVLELGQALATIAGLCKHIFFARGLLFVHYMHQGELPGLVLDKLRGEDAGGT
jgi:hypothetical protein